MVIDDEDTEIGRVYALVADSKKTKVKVTPSKVKVTLSADYTPGN